jgi:hypothetical protein
MDGERAGVHIADRVDQAHHPAGAAHVQAGQGAGLTERRQMEEGVTREHPLTLGDQPVIELDLLGGSGVLVVPHICAPPRGPQPGDPQGGTVTACQRGEFVELVDVVPGDHNGDLRVGEARRGQVFQRTYRHGE